MAQSDQENADAADVEDLPELMAAYQAGQIEAFERLYERLVKSIRGYLRRLAPAGTDVEDLVQTAFLQLHRSRQTYWPGQPVRPWVFSIARHVGLMARRSSQRRGKNEVQPATDLPEIAAPSPSTLDRLALEQALDSLHDDGREALWLHHVEGLSFREIAQVQGISEGAAKVRSHRARIELRARLTEASS
jgi:RNA polymerase sigma-70 factor (ECF subfamily)